MQRCCYKCFIESEHLYCLENYYTFFMPMDRLTPMRCGIGAIPPLGAEWPVCHKATVVDNAGHGKRSAGKVHTMRTCI